MDPWSWLKSSVTWGGVDVPVAHGGHGDDAVVDGGGDGGEAGVVVQLNEVAETADDEAGDAHQEHQQGQLLHTQSSPVSIWQPELIHHQLKYNQLKYHQLIYHQLMDTARVDWW